MDALSFPTMLPVKTSPKRCWRIALIVVAAYSDIFDAFFNFFFMCLNLAHNVFIYWIRIVDMILIGIVSALIRMGTILVLTARLKNSVY